jgi:hypothetical protein
MKNILILLFALLPLAFGEPLSASCIFDPMEVPVEGVNFINILNAPFCTLVFEQLFSTYVLAL